MPLFTKHEVSRFNGLRSKPLKRFHFIEALVATLLKQGVNEIARRSLLLQGRLHNGFHLIHALSAKADKVLEDSAVAIDDE